MQHQHPQQAQQQAPPPQQQQHYGNLGKRPTGAQAPVSFAPQPESEDDGDMGLSDIQVREITKVVSRWNNGSLCADLSH